MIRSWQPVRLLLIYPPTTNGSTHTATTKKCNTKRQQCLAPDLGQLEAGNIQRSAISGQISGGQDSRLPPHGRTAEHIAPGQSRGLITSHIGISASMPQTAGLGDEDCGVSRGDGNICRLRASKVPSPHHCQLATGRRGGHQQGTDDG